MENFLNWKLAEKRKSLNLSVPQVAKLLNLSSSSVYKWEGGTRPNEYSHVKKLEKFIDGLFDQFVKDGKLPADYDYDEVQKILYPPSPTNDHWEANNLLHEDQVAYANKDEQIKAQRIKIAELQQLVIDTKSTAESLKELQESMNVVQQRHADVLTRSQAVQEVLLEYLASLNKTSYQDIFARVRIKENEIRKNAS